MSSTTLAANEKIKLRDPITVTILAALTVLLALGSSGISRFSFSGATSWFKIPLLQFQSRPVAIVLAVLALVIMALTWFYARGRRKIPAWMVPTTASLMILAFLVFAVAGHKNAIVPVVSLITGAIAFAIPLVFGSLSGVVCERSGVINIAIEGQLLAGAFAGAVAASVWNSAYLGMIAAPVAGVLVAVLLALFTVNLRTDHIIVGVVLNMLVIGLTSFLFSSVLKEDPQHLNRAVTLAPIKIPILGDIPIIGPALFNQSLLAYLMYAAIIVLQIMLFRSKWGLRARACGEHPRAADTVGIKVNRIRWQNVLLGGALAGLGGAFFTIGQGLAFSKDMAAGNGFIALAAMILGRWNPKGAAAAALLFGFATNLGFTVQAIGSAVPAEFLLMIPYIITILAVAGYVGIVRPPAAEGKPYPA
ncbi:MAG: ABC transporter permease [Actinomycetaceae bacterium]|nr:ABC transporter permease [Actinomycetaceae bacterium]